LLVSIAGGSRPRLVQLDAHGSTDRRFGPSHDGAIAFLDSITPDATGLHWPGDVAYQSDGRILLSGAARDLNSGNLETLAVARLGADGSYDSTFGAGGVARFSFGGVAGSGDTINALALTDGHALAVGSSYNGKPLIASLLLH
jgi:hypothetical protein